MKKVLGLVFLVLTVFLASCTKTKPTLTFESTNINIKVNEEFTLTPTITNGKKGAKVIYEVLDDTVLSYQDGKFKGLKVGTTKIDAQIENVKDTKVEINVTVEAEIIPSYSITYHLNGGVNPANAPTTFIEADLPITLPSPTKDGYDFLGWFNNSAFTGDALTTIPAGSKQNISLYANWDEEEVSASITYNLNGGTNHPEAQATYTNKQLPYTLEIPTRQGFVFVGWYKDSAFINEVKELQLVENTTVYAKWLEKYAYTLNYELNGGTNHQDNISSYDVYDLPIILKEPTKDGYEFKGWYLNNTFNGASLTQIDVAHDTKVFARFELITEDVPVQNNVYVNPNLLTADDNSKVTYKGVEYTVGVNAFGKLSDALAVATDKVFIEGEITENVTISNNNITLMGPNAFINPNTGERADEAIIKGVITIAAKAENITINGLSFTGSARVVASEIDNFRFTYNKVYDTTKATATWIEAAGYTSGFMTFSNGANDMIRNLIFNYNRFENVSDANINFTRVENVTVDNNVFKNFERDAIRFDTGGYNTGELVFTNNDFVNDVMGGYNGIYFRIYGGTDAQPATIIVRHNNFKNIGQVSQSYYSGAFSARNYQEKKTDVIIEFNVFETCANYINIRNNATSANHASNPWTGKANYNVFKGVPTTYYYRNWSGTDSATTNPITMDFELNYYEDNSGNPIVDLLSVSSKFFNVASYANNFETITAYNEAVLELQTGKVDLYVSAEWESNIDTDKVDFNGKELIIGENAFSSLNDAIDAASEGNVIYVISGTYAENVEINKNDLTITSANMNKDPNTEARSPEATFTGIINIAAGVSGLEINGLGFTGAGKVTSSGGISDFTFIYNNFVASTVGSGDNGLLFLKGESTNVQQHYRVNVSYNRFVAAGSPRIVNIDKLEDLTFVGNYLESSKSEFNDALRVYYLSSTMPVLIESNTFYQFQQFPIFFSAQTSATQIDIINNMFESVSSGIQIRAYTGFTQENQAFINIEYNTFKNITNSSGASGSAIRVDHTGTVETSMLDINVKFNKFVDTTPSTYFSNNVTGGTAAKLEQNFFSEGVSPASSKFTGVASNTNNFATIEEVPTYDTGAIIVPTDVVINNPIAELELLTTYQLSAAVVPANSSVKKVNFSSSNPGVATVSSSGLITALSEGMVTITVSSEANGNIATTLTFEVVSKERLDVRYNGNGAIKVNEELTLEAEIHSNTNEQVTYTSSDTLIATVDASGVVTGKASGNVIITATVGELSQEVGITVYGDEVTDDLIKYFIEINTGVLFTKEILYIGSDDGKLDYPNRIYNTVSDFHFGTYTTTKNMLPEGRQNHSGVTMNSIEFIAIHDTAGSASSSTAQANSNWCINPTNTGTSWHYTIGNEGVFQQLEDTIKGYHAGDGSREFELLNTGVEATTDKPTIIVNERGYFELNGVESDILAPIAAQITENGIYTTVIDGYYWMNKTHFASFKTIANHGGNNNSIGIETAVNNGSDVYYTWHLTAKHAVMLALKHDLGVDRIVTHNHFSGKPCPRTMMTAGLLDEFYDLVHAEYNIQKNFSDYEIEFISNNTEIIDNTGRVISAPVETTNVTYTIKVTKGSTTHEITLNALVPGQYTW